MFLCATVPFAFGVWKQTQILLITSTWKETRYRKITIHSFFSFLIPARLYLSLSQNKRSAISDRCQGSKSLIWIENCHHFATFFILIGVNNKIHVRTHLILSQRLLNKFFGVGTLIAASARGETSLCWASLFWLCKKL